MLEMKMMFRKKRVQHAVKLVLRVMDWESVCEFFLKLVQLVRRFNVCYSCKWF